MTKVYYHGSSKYYSYRSPETMLYESASKDMMFLSESPNVAHRYGEVYSIEIDTKGMQRITVQEWFDGNIPETGSFLITGDDGYDFPVDTLVLRRDPGTHLNRVKDIDSLDDGLALVHDPEAPTDRQFQKYIDEHYEGDISLWKKEVYRLSAAQQA